MTILIFFICYEREYISTCMYFISEALLLSTHNISFHGEIKKYLDFKWVSLHL